jgi:hypothetical protein
MPVATPAEAWDCGRSLVGTAGSNPTVSMDACLCECRVLSGRGFCDGLITRPKESYQCDRLAWTVRRPWPIGGCWAFRGGGGACCVASVIFIGPVNTGAMADLTSFSQCLIYISFK